MKVKTIPDWRTILALVAGLAALATSACSTVNVNPNPTSNPEDVKIERQGLNVDLRMDRTEYRIGDTMQLFVRPSRTAKIMVISVDAMQRQTVLFPNDHTASSWLAGGETHLIPHAGAQFRLRVVPPAGGNLIRVIATTSQEPILEPQSLVRGTGPFPSYTGSPDSIARRVEAAAVAEPDQQWTMRDYHFRVLP